MPSLGEIAAALDEALAGGADVRGDRELEIRGLGPIETAAPGDITHLSSPAYRRFLAATDASAVLLRAADAADCPGVPVVVDNPYLAFALVSQLFDDAPRAAAGVHPTAHVDASADVHETAAVGPGACVRAGAKIGAGTVLGPGCHVGEDSVVGRDGTLHANAVVYHGVRIGDRCTIHSGAVIGADGFGFTPDEKGVWQPIAQLGGVRLGDDVSIGAGTTIDRGAIEDTVVSNGVKIDNQVQIGHNCHIGEHTLICGCVGIVGSTRIGRHCVFGGGAGVGGDGPIEICDNVQVGVVTTITRSIKTPGVYSGGVLHNTNAAWKRNAMRFQHLDELARRVGRLERAVAGGEPRRS